MFSMRSVSKGQADRESNDSNANVQAFVSGILWPTKFLAESMLKYFKEGRVNLSSSFAIWFPSPGFCGQTKRDKDWT